MIIHTHTTSPYKKTIITIIKSTLSIIDNNKKPLNKKEKKLIACLLDQKMKHQKKDCQMKHRRALSNEAPKMDCHVSRPTTKVDARNSKQ